MDNLRITTVQSDLHWENPNANREMFEKLLTTVAESDVIVLPEMFTTGFSMQPEIHGEEVEPDSGPTLNWMRRIASDKEAVVCGSVAVKEQGYYFNRLYWVEPSGQMVKYDKKHLFSLGKEHEHYTAGEERVIANYKGWSISLNICYDLRFPVWLRNTMSHDSPSFDIQLFVANWPKPRTNHWRSLLQARAIENQCYVVGVNRIGEDANGMPHSGASGIIDYQGDWISEHADNTPDSLTKEISFAELQAFRAKLPFLKDQHL